MITALCLIVGSFIAIATVILLIISNKFKREFECEKTFRNAKDFLKRDQ
jgi:hypothetical protein